MQNLQPSTATPRQAPSPRGRAGMGLLLFLLLISLPAFSQFSKPRRQYVEYLLTASNADRNYKTGEQASLTIEAYKGGLALDGVMVHYRVGDEMFLPAAEDSVALRRRQGRNTNGYAQRTGLQGLQPALHRLRQGVQRPREGGFQPRADKALHHHAARLRPLLAESAQGRLPPPSSTPSSRRCQAAPPTAWRRSSSSSP